MEPEQQAQQDTTIQVSEPKTDASTKEDAGKSNEQPQNEAKYIEEEKKENNSTPSAKLACNACGKSDVELLKCGGCGNVRYCSSDCQKKDWKNHKPNCNFKPKATEKIKEPAEPEDRADLYDHLKLVGEGNFSQIFLVRRKGKEETYAMKVVNKQRVKMLHKENDLLMEKHCLIKMKDSEYVIDYIESFQNFLNLYLVMEYMPGGELWDLVKCFGLPSQSIVKYYFAHVVNAVTAIHEKGIVHRDLKVNNTHSFILCLMIDNNSLKISCLMRLRRN